jgi:tyrosyl-tRNA synthetase
MKILLNCFRKPDNGGAKEYLNIEELEKDFAEGILHPADFKPAVTKLINDFLDRSRNSDWKVDPSKKAIADIKNFLKKIAKK